ncbi:ABC transporter ATP-binding protein, partial [bacterium]|nr:ABC transporter ATP-binding protein [bacterium]
MREPTETTLFTLLQDFFTRHQTLFSTSLFLLFIIFPVELVVISHVTSKIYIALSDISLSRKRQNHASLKRLLFYAFLFLFFFALIEVCAHLRDHFDSIIMPNLFQHFRERIIEASITANEQNFEDLPTGELLVRLMRTPYISYQSYNVLFKMVVPVYLMVIVSCIYIIVLCPPLGVRLLILFMVQLWIYLWAVIRSCWWNRREVQSEADFFELVEDTLSHLFVVTSSGKVKEELERLRNSQLMNLKMYQSEMRFINQVKRSVSFSTIVITMYAIGMTLYYFSVEKRISLENVVALITLSIFLCRNIMPMAKRGMESVGYAGGMMDQNR